MLKIKFIIFLPKTALPKVPVPFGPLTICNLGISTAHLFYSPPPLHP